MRADEPRHLSRTSAGPGRIGLAGTVRLFTTLLLALGLLAPFAAAGAAAPVPASGANAALAAPRDDAPPPFPAPDRVVVVGDFQGAFGCGGWDKECAATELTDDGSGVWSVVLPIPAGSWPYRIVTRGDIDRSLGRDADPDGQDLIVDVPDGALGVFFSYNHPQGLIVGAPILTQIEIASDFGVFPATPAPEGGYEAFVELPAGQYLLTALVGGAPAGTADAILNEDGVARVLVDDGGNIFAVEPRVPGILYVTKTDESGAPVPGSCFSVYTSRGLVAQACDADDRGGDDGAIEIFFPRGLEPNAYILAESRTPDGVPAADDQEIYLGRGENYAQAFVAGGGGGGEAATYDAYLYPIDESGNSVYGACYSIDGYGQVCDDGSGVIVFFGLADGIYTVYEDVAPQGYDPAQPFDIEIAGAGVEVPVPHTAQAAATYDLIIYPTDADTGQSVYGACYSIDGYGQVCDDGSGVIVFSGLPNGQYLVYEDVAPEGYVGVEPFAVDLFDAVAEVAAPHVALTTPVYALTLYPQDEAGNPVFGACFSIDGYGQVCDDGSATVVFAGLENGVYTVYEDVAPEGYDPVQPFEAQIADADTQLAVSHVASGGGEADTGTLVVTALDDAGAPLAGACYRIRPLADSVGGVDTELCDDADGALDGVTRFENQAVGSYRLVETLTPDGWERGDRQNVDVLAGETTETSVAHTSTLGAESEGATLIFAVTDADGFAVVGACVAVDGPFGFEVCDNGEGDEDLAEGVIQVSGAPLGEYLARNTYVPDGYELAADTPFVVESTAEPIMVMMQPATVAQTATLRVLTRDGDGAPIGGACYAIDGGEPVCDDGSGDLAVADVRAGEPAVLVEMVAAPAGYGGAAAQEILLEAGVDGELTFVVNLAAGDLAIYTRDGDNAALAGACYALNGGAPVCDNGDGDADPVDGNLLLVGVAAGDYTVTQESAPAGYDPAAAQNVTIEAQAAASLVFVNVATPPAMGRIYVVTRNEAGEDLEGACYLLIDAAGTEFGPYCDQGAGDTDEDPGQMRVTEIPVGPYEVRQVQPPQGFTLAEAQTFEVISDEAARATFINLPAGGQITVRIQDAAETPLTGWCVTIGDLGQFCDGDTGEVALDVPAGEIAITVDTVPAGYTLPNGESATVSVEAGQPLIIIFPAEPVPTFGTLAVTFTWEGDAPAEPLCVVLNGGQQVCDNGPEDTDPAVGRVVVEGLQPGAYGVGFVPPAGGFQTAEEQQVEIVGDGVTEVVFTVAAIPTPEATTEPTAEPAPAGSLRIVVTYDGDAAVSGGCYTISGGANAGPICDDGAGDASATPNEILIEGLTPGLATVAQSTAPEGYTAAAPVAVEILDGDTVQVDLQNSAAEAELGSLEAQVADESDAPVGGACITVGGVEICDNGVGDSDPAPGVIAVDGVFAGPYEVSMTGTPDGFDTPDPVEVQVTADEPATAAFTLAEEPVETGSVELTLEDIDGNPTPGACLLVTGGPNGDFAEVVCDDASLAGTGGLAAMRLQADGLDADPRAGIILIQDLAAGVYEVLQGEPGGGPDPAAFQAAEVPSRTITIVPNTIVQVIVIIIVIPAEVGDVVIIKLDDQNQLLGGACFTLFGPDPGTPYEVCDNEAEDSNGTVGILRVNGLENGDYQIAETQTPPGYEPALDQTLTVGGTVAIIEIINVPMENPLGSLTVFKVDDNGDPLPGACFQIVEPSLPSVIAAQICDRDAGAGADGAADGTIAFVDVMAGTWVLQETQAPSADYYAIAPQSVTIVADAETTIDVVNVLRPGRLQIAKVDGDGAYLDGACFLIDGVGIYEICDNDPADASPLVGVIRFNNVPAGDYTVVETQAPLGYAPAADETVAVVSNVTTYLTVVNEPETPPTDFGTVVVSKVGPNGLPLAGACFSLRVGVVTRVPTTCDGADGANDGTIILENVPVGTYTLRETVKPSADYQQAADRAVEVFKDETTYVTVENAFRPGRVLVYKVDQWGNPIEGACFDLSPDGKGPKCSNWAGEILFDNLEPGTYKLRETVVPPGYEKAPDKTGIVVLPGLTTTITVVNKAGPPPDGHGSIRVIKFYCVAGKGGAMTIYYDSSDGVPNPIDKTAGCTKGDAGFEAVLTVDPSETLTFRTGSDGEAQRFLLAGNWTLTEEATGESEPFRVYEGQQTTIVVINYVVPPPPAPSKIVVTKYTCDAGFAGSYWADFQAACTSEDALTNNVTIRLAGDLTAARVTGDGGQTGQTRFTNLAAGSYKVYEDKPAGAGTYYMFCGVNPSAPDYKAVDAGIWFTLASGQTTYCTFYNVPDDLSDSRGAITVYKYVCDAGDYPPGFDWESECSVLTTGVKFGISVWNGTTWTPRTSAITNEDGIVRFSQLQPGTYQLKEIGGEWCHAESDSVNANGDLIVRAGQRTTVWIYNCVPPRQGPNTGEGPGSSWSTPTAPAQIAPAATPVSAVGLAMVWPALALGGGLVWRRRRAA